MTDLAHALVFWIGPVNAVLCLIGVPTRDMILKLVALCALAVLLGVQVAAAFVVASQ